MNGYGKQLGSKDMSDVVVLINRLFVELEQAQGYNFKKI